MFEAIIAAGERLSRIAGLRAVVLAGAGKGFCAGLDKETFASLAEKGAPTLGDLTKRTHGIANAFQQAAYVWRMLPVPVIAAIHGVALGGGFQIALGADIRYVAPDARLAIMEIKWGIVPDMSGIALMRELARSDVIRELAMTGRIFSGTEALAYGFATSLHADPLAAARSTAKAIAARNPDAVRAVKRLLNAASDSDAAAILLAEFERAGGADRIAKSDRGGARGDGGKAGTIRGRRIDKRAGSSGLVLFVGDLVHPVGRRLVYGDMGHGGGRRGAVPVLLAGRDQDDVAGTNLLDRSALPLNATRAGRDDKNLALRMGVPRSPSAGLESDDSPIRPCGRSSAQSADRCAPHR